MALVALRNGLFGSFYVVSKKAKTTLLNRVLTQAIRYLQMYAFLVDSQAGLPWLSATIQPARELTFLPAWVFFGWIRRFQVDAAYFAAVFISIAWVVVYAGLQLWAVVAFSRNSISAIWPLKLLRTIANFSATVAYIPLFQFLLSVYVCVPVKGSGTLWTDNGYTCYQGAHLALVIIATLLAALLLALCALFALLFYDSHPLSSDSDEEEEERDGGRERGEDDPGTTDDLDEVDWDAVFAQATGPAGVAAAAVAARRCISNFGADIGSGAIAPITPSHGRRGSAASRTAFDFGGGGAGAGASVPTTSAPRPATRPIVVATVRRKAIKSWRSYIRLGGFMLPNLAVLIFTAIIYTITASTIANVSSMQRQFTLASYRLTQIPELFSLLRRSIRRVGFNAEIVEGRDETWDVALELRTSQQYMLYGLSGDQVQPLKPGLEVPLPETVAAGAEADGIPQLGGDVNSLLRTVVLGDACEYVAAQPPSTTLTTAPTVQECRDFLGGKARTGANFLMTHYLDYAVYFLTVLEESSVDPISANGEGILTIPPTSASIAGRVGITLGSSTTAVVVPFFIPEVLASEDLANMQQLDERYLRPVYTGIATIYRSATLSMVDRYQIIVVAVIVVAILLITLSIALCYLPAIWAMDRDVHRKRGLLLLLPAQTLQFVPSLRDFVEDIVAGGSGATVAARARAESQDGAATGRPRGGSDADAAAVPVAAPAPAGRNGRAAAIGGGSTIPAPPRAVQPVADARSGGSGGSSGDSGVGGSGGQPRSRRHNAAGRRSSHSYDGRSGEEGGLSSRQAQARAVDLIAGGFGSRHEDLAARLRSRTLSAGVE